MEEHSADHTIKKFIDLKRVCVCVCMKVLFAILMMVTSSVFTKSNRVEWELNSLILDNIAELWLKQPEVGKLINGSILSYTPVKCTIYIRYLTSRKNINE